MYSRAVAVDQQQCYALVAVEPNDSVAVFIQDQSLVRLTGVCVYAGEEGEWPLANITSALLCLSCHQSAGSVRSKDAGGETDWAFKRTSSETIFCGWAAWHHFISQRRALRQRSFLPTLPSTARPGPAQPPNVHGWTGQLCTLSRSLIKSSSRRGFVTGSGVNQHLFIASPLRLTGRISSRHVKFWAALKKATGPSGLDKGIFSVLYMVGKKINNKLLIQATAVALETMWGILFLSPLIFLRAQALQQTHILPGEANAPPTPHKPTHSMQQIKFHKNKQRLSRRRKQANCTRFQFEWESWFVRFSLIRCDKRVIRGFTPHTGIIIPLSKKRERKRLQVALWAVCLDLFWAATTASTQVESPSWNISEMTPANHISIDTKLAKATNFHSSIKFKNIATQLTRVCKINIWHTKPIFPKHSGSFLTNCKITAGVRVQS